MKETEKHKKMASVAEHEQAEAKADAAMAKSMQALKQRTAALSDEFEAEEK